ncbi:MAG TPA: hypothetical protein VGG74_02440 [Kofleriaceae bacterium]
MTRAALVIVLCAASVAHADKQASLAHYAAGKAAYTAGRFDDAVAEFQLAYGEDAAPEYLQDLAQAYRHLGRCPDALAYLERYLAAEPDAPRKDELASELAELRATCAPPAPPLVHREPPRRPESVAAIVAPPAVPDVGPEPAIASESQPPIAAVAATPSAWSFGARADLALLGAGPVIMPPVVRVDAIARYALDELGYWHVAAGITVAPIPYDDLMRGTAWLAGPIASADVDWPLGHGLALVGDVAAGAEVAWGLGAGNPFTTDDRAASATLLPFARAGAGIAWRAADAVELRVLPLGYEVTLARGAFASDVSALRGYELGVGVVVTR